MARHGTRLRPPRNIHRKLRGGKNNGAARGPSGTAAPDARKLYNICRDDIGRADSRSVVGSGVGTGVSQPADQDRRRSQSGCIRSHRRGTSAAGLGSAGDRGAAPGRRWQARGCSGGKRGSRRPHAPVRHPHIHAQRRDEARVLRSGEGIRGGLDHRTDFLRARRTSGRARPFCRRARRLGEVAPRWSQLRVRRHRHGAASRL